MRFCVEYVFFGRLVEWNCATFFMSALATSLPLLRGFTVLCCLLDVPQTEDGVDALSVLLQMSTVSPFTIPLSPSMHVRVAVFLL